MNLLITYFRDNEATLFLLVLMIQLFNVDFIAKAFDLVCIFLYTTFSNHMLSLKNRLILIFAIYSIAHAKKIV